EASSSRFANSRARAKAARVSDAEDPLTHLSALPRLVCKRSRLLPGAMPGAVAASLSANSIALPRWAAASLKAERRKAWSPAFPHQDSALEESGFELTSHLTG